MFNTILKKSIKFNHQLQAVSWHLSNKFCEIERSSGIRSAAIYCGHVKLSVALSGAPEPMVHKIKNANSERI